MNIYRKIAKVFIVLLVCGILFSVVASIWGSVDGLIWFNKLDKLTWEKLSFWKEENCDMPGCVDKATASVTYFIGGGKDAKKLNITNTAGFTIDKGSEMVTEYEKVNYKEKYDTITYIGGGTFVLGETQVEKSAYLEGKTFERHYTKFGGVYCDIHKEQAVATLKAEIVEAANKDPIYFVGCTLAPYQYWVGVFLIGLCYQLGFSVPNTGSRMREMDESGLRKVIKEKISNQLIPAAIFPFLAYGVVWLVFKFMGLISQYGIDINGKLMLSLFAVLAVFPAWVIGCIIIVIKGKIQLRKNKTT